MIVRRELVPRWTIALLGLVMGACQAHTPTVTPVPFKVVASAPNAELDSTLRTAIRTEEEWSRYQKTLQGATKVNTVAFQFEMLLLVVGPPAGYTDSVRIIRVENNGKSLTVTVVSYYACATAAISVRPAEAVAVPKSDAPVHFVSEAERAPNCLDPGRRVTE